MPARLKLPLGAALLQAALVLAALVPTGPALAQTPPSPPLLLIVHTADAHGHALEERDGGGPLVRAGYARLKGYFEAQAAHHKMLLSAGDVLHGQALAVAGRGEFIARILALMGYDAFAAGNHDFDHGLARLMDLANRYRLSFIAANITGREDGALILPPYVVRDFGGLKVGVFGLSTPETAYKTAPANVAAVDFGNPETLAATAREMTRMLREKEKADLVVALTHVGADPGSRPDSAFLARAAPGLDLVVDGHSHLAQPGLRVGRTLIVSAGAFLENVGRVEVRRGPRGRLELTSGLVRAAELENMAPDPAVAAEVARVAAELEPALKAVVARTPFFFNGDREEARRDSTNLGRLVCAAMMKYTGAEAALINSGSLRGSLPAGEVTLGQVLSALPFGNYALTVRLSGRDLRTILNSTLARPGRGAFPQFYGLTVTVREVPPLGSIPAGPRYRVEAVEIGGRPLVPEAEYLVAVNDFMLAGGDQYGIPAENNRGRIREFGSVEEMLRRFLAEAAPEDMVAIDRDDNLTIIAEEK